MIKEAYVSFEVAKLLREKGFDEPCFAYYNVYYDPKGKDLKLWRKFPHRIPPNTDYLNVPTHQIAMKWLREVHKVFFCVHPDYPISKNYMVEFYDKSRPSGCFGNYSTYEEAIEAALKYCLENLI